MKFIVSLLTLFWTADLFAQNLDSLGFNDRPILNESEVTLLNSLLAEKGDTFNFKDKKVAFITGSSGSMVRPKSEYFKKSVIPWIEKDSKPQISVIHLSDEEKLKSGGYDVLVLSWVKLFTERRRRKTIEFLGARIP